jgi:hypothetical protein
MQLGAITFLEHMPVNQHKEFSEELSSQGGILAGSLGAGLPGNHQNSQEEILAGSSCL